MPWDLVEAVAQANRILDWYQNLTEDDIPPEWMWPFPEEIEEWFGEVRAKRRMPGDNRETVPMTKNEDPRITKLRGS